MSTARQRRRKGGRRSRRRQNRKAGLVSNLRQRVTMEVARRANLLGLTMQPRSLEGGHDQWTFFGRHDVSVLEYFPVSATVYRPLACLVGKEPDVRKVLEMAARINHERPYP